MSAVTSPTGIAGQIVGFGAQALRFAKNHVLNKISYIALGAGINNLLKPSISSKCKGVALVTGFVCYKYPQIVRMAAEHLLGKQSPSQTK